MRKIIGAILLGSVLAATAWAGEPILVPWHLHPARKPTELLVKYRSGAASLQGTGAVSGLAGLGVVRVPLAGTGALAAAAAAWTVRPDVEWAQPNYWRQALAQEVVPNDPYYLPQRNSRRYQQWFLPKINANYAWSLDRGSDGLTAAVVDTGVDIHHPDLAGRLLPGVSLVHQDGYTAPADGMDDHGHGTHIAGLIAAQTDNALGVAGCAWAGKVLPIKVLNAKGEGTDADIAEGILYAADHGARLINLSLGGPDDGAGPPPVLQAAVDYATARGCLVIAAAGNSGDRQVTYPAALPKVLAVAATDPADAVASYSTRGAWIDLAAPGGSGAEALTRETGILSTFWDENSASTDFMGGSEAGEYAITVGTSMAAGVVTGAALVLWSEHPAWTADQVAGALKATAADVGAPGADEATGSGRIDLLAALGNPPAEHPNLTCYGYPNPFSPETDGGVTIVFYLEAPAGVTLSVYDASRDLVWRQTLGQAETSAGKNSVRWDGRNGVGQAVANGAYFLRMAAEGQGAGTTKILAVLR